VQERPPPSLDLFETTDLLENAVLQPFDAMRAEAMPFEMFEVGPSLTEAEVDGLERQLGIVLPKKYRSFLLRYNGGRPEPTFFPIRGFNTSPFGAIHYFFGISRAVRSSNIDWNFRMYKGRMPSELLPIAGDELGNRICLFLAGTNEGCVYFWDHDNEKSPPTYANLYPVASSLEEFFDSIHFEDISGDVANSLGNPSQSGH
jgi:hypothetical protein